MIIQYCEQQDPSNKLGCTGGDCDTCARCVVHCECPKPPQLSIEVQALVGALAILQQKREQTVLGPNSVYEIVFHAYNYLDVQLKVLREGAQ